MTPPDNRPPERKPSLYQMTNESERKGSGGLIVFILVLILAGAGAAYYFNQQKKAAVATSTLPAAPTPTPPKPVPTPTPAPTGYNDVTKQSYITQADNAFVAVQQPKKQAFTDSFAAFQTAGGMSSKGLTSKEAVTARRDLIAKCLTANDEYASFVTGQEAFYKEELAKTPLIPADIAEVLAGYAEKAKTATVLKLRQTQHDSLKTADDIMALLEKSYGNWNGAATGRLTFKRPPDEAAYRALSQKYTAEVAQLTQLFNELKGPAAAAADGSAPSGSDNPSASTSPAAAPTASPATPSAPAVSPAASPTTPR